MNLLRTHKILLLPILIKLLSELLLTLPLDFLSQLQISCLDLSEFNIEHSHMLVHLFLLFADLCDLTTTIVHRTLHSSPLIQEAF